MTIKREINGQVVEIQLTDAERYNAWKEETHLYDVGEIDAIYDGEELLDTEVFDKMATLARAYISASDAVLEAEERCYRDAIEVVLRGMKVNT